MKTAIRDNRFLGTCACGCGQRTNVLAFDDHVSGRKSGQHEKYIRYHQPPEPCPFCQRIATSSRSLIPHVETCPMYEERRYAKTVATAPKIRQLLELGASYRDITETLGVTKRTVALVKGNLKTVRKIAPKNPSGFCMCGCGEKTRIATSNDYQTGRMIGEHYLYIHGHVHNAIRKQRPEWGRQSQRNKLVQVRRVEIVTAILESKGVVSLQEIASNVAPEFRLQDVSRMVNKARTWTWKWEIPHIIIRKPRKAFIPYERTEIPYERETELPLIVNRRNAMNLDAPRFDDDEDGYGIVACGNMTPLELLMLKEDMESEEEQDRARRIAEWRDWDERKRPLLNLGELLSK